MKDRRLYIALFFAAVIGGGWWYTASLKESLKQEVVSFDEDAWQEAVEESGIELVDKTHFAEEEVSTEEVAETEIELFPEEQPTQSESTAVEVASDVAEPFSMIKPCDGDIVGNCSLEELVYCIALDDWRTHNGIDYTANVGNPVYASADGVVEKVFEDELLGLSLVLNHQNGVLSVYGNMQKEKLAIVGATLKKGEVLGYVGSPGSMETGLSERLHFEVQCNGEYVNPMEYMNME